MNLKFVNANSTRIILPENLVYLVNFKEIIK